jgi:glutamine amidotransferase
MAYSGDPILAYELLFRPQHSIIDQSLHSQLGAERPTATASDRLVREGLEPAVFKSIEPAWNDWNLRELAARSALR